MALWGVAFVGGGGRGTTGFNNFSCFTSNGPLVRIGVIAVPRDTRTLGDPDRSASIVPVTFMPVVTVTISTVILVILVPTTLDRFGVFSFSACFAPGDFFRMFDPARPSPVDPYFF